MAGKCGQLAVVAIATLLCCLVGFSDALLAVMSIDLGSEYMKIAIVKPGVPMEIITNDDSSRKTANIVAMRNGERLFGNAAETVATRFPNAAFWYLTHIIGKKYNDPQVIKYMERFPYYNLVRDEERDTVLFQVDEETQYSPEELLAMILEKAKDYAEKFADQPIKDCVITIPSYLNQAERRAMMYAAEMSGLNVLQLIGDNTAVALNYGVFRRKQFTEKMQYYMFYDMGASSTTATVVGYQLVKTKEGTRVESNPHLFIKGVGYDMDLGGLEISMRLRNHMAKHFNTHKKTKKDLFSNDRAMAKLLKEAKRVKKVLSANVDHLAQIEGLLDDEDFKLKVERAQLEEMCHDLFDRVTKPIEDALKASEITVGELTDVILMGGGTRIPAVQAKLLKFLGRTELGKSINTDEAAALGAVYQAAHLGKGFKVLKFGIKEATVFPITVQFEKHRSSEVNTEPARIITRTLFGRMNPFPQKKVMTFTKHLSDFDFNVTYGDLDFMTEEQAQIFKQLQGRIQSVQLKGVEESYQKHADKAESKGIKAHFKMDDSGILTLEKVEYVFEKEEEEVKEESAWSKLGGTISGLFGSSDTKETTTEETADKSEGEKSAGTEEQPDKTGSDQAKPDETSPNKTEPEQTQDDQTASEEPRKEEDKPPSEEVGADEEQKPENMEDRENTEEKEVPKEEGQDKEEPKEGTKEESTEKKEEDKTDDGKKEETNKKEKKSDDKKNGKDEKKDEGEKKPKIIVIRENITTDTVVTDVASPSKEQVKASKKKLSDLTARDKEKKLLEKARNELESFIFDGTDKLTQELYEKCSTEEERESINVKLAEASDWLYDQEEDAKKEVFIDKLKELKKVMKGLESRVTEAKERPQALEALNSMLNHSDFFLTSLKNLSSIEVEPIFTTVEIETLEKLVNETEDWKKNMVEEQKKTPNYEKPKLLVEDIATKIRALDREVKYLINKAKTFKPKSKPKSTKNKTESKNDTILEEDTIPANETKDTSSEEPIKEQEDTTPEGATEQATREEGLETELPPPPTEDSPKEEEETLQLGDGNEDTTTTTTAKPTQTPKETNTHDAGDL